MAIGYRVRGFPRVTVSEALIASANYSIATFMSDDVEPHMNMVDKRLLRKYLPPQDGIAKRTDFTSTLSTRQTGRLTDSRRGNCRRAYGGKKIREFAHGRNMPADNSFWRNGRSPNLLRCANTMKHGTTCRNPPAGARIAAPVFVVVVHPSSISSADGWLIGAAELSSPRSIHSVYSCPALCPRTFCL